MARRTYALAVWLLTAAAALGSGAPWAAADDGPAARRAFLLHRDVARLETELVRAGEPADGPVMALVRIARGLRAQGAPAAAPARGLAALPEVLEALHALDLGAAGRAAPCADCVDGGVAAGWAGALVRIRRGDDAGATGRLLAPPLFEWERDAFALALLGAALPEDDRLMLAAGGRAALEHAAARGRAAAVAGTALALAALDPGAGREAFVLAARALRRGGDLEGAERLLGAAAEAGVSLGASALALEAALCAWARGEAAAVGARLTGVPPPPGSQSSFLALRRAGRRARAIDTGGPLRHARGDDAHALLVARLARALGVAASGEEVKRWAEKRKTRADHAGLARAYLEQRGLSVLSVAGDAGAADALLAAGRPFLLYRIEREDTTYRDVAALVRGYDARTGLWLLDEPDIGRLDVFPRAAVVKARVLCAVPAEQRHLLAPFNGAPAGRHGRLLEEALDRADRADFEGALERLGSLGGAAGAIGDLYRGYVQHRIATERRSDEALERAHEAVRRSRRTPPLLGFEDYVRGQALVVAGDRPGGVGALEIVERLEGPSATLAMAFFAAHQAEGELNEALAAMERAARLAPLDSRVLFYRAAARAAVRDFDGARADLRRALDRRPDAVRVAVALAGLELQAERPAAALEVVRDTIRRDPTLADHASLQSASRSAEMALIEQAPDVAALAAARRSREPETRRRLAFALADREQEGDAAEALLRELLADEDASVRVSTLRLYMRPWLRRRVEADAVLGRQVCAILAQDVASGVRAAAAGLLARLESTLGLTALATALAGVDADAEPSVRTAAARALRGREELVARTALVDALADADLTVRQASIDSLFELAATTRGYEAEEDEFARAGPIAEWRTWLGAER